MITVRANNYNLVVGIAISVVGFLIFINLSAGDFLSPGFVTKETLLQSAQINSQDFISTSIQIDNERPVTFLISSFQSSAAFDILVESPKGTTYHYPNLVKPTITFRPDSAGIYLVTVKNLSSKTTTVNVEEGYLKQYDNSQVLLLIISMFMIIGGNYFIVHNHFASLPKYS